MTPNSRAPALLIALASLSVLTPGGFAANLVTNGDFTLGPVGFTSDYPLNPDLTWETRYAVGTDPHLFHAAALSFGDHTTGTGNMLLVNAATAPGLVAWRQTFSVLPNSTYQFSYWACSWGSDGTGNDQSPARLKALLNGQELAAALLVPKADAVYVNFTAPWNSGPSTTATLEIIDVNTSGVGNDFILDDIAFDGPAVPEPAVASVGTMTAAAAALVTRRRGRRASGDR